MQVKIRLPHPLEDIKAYPAFDFTKLSAVNTCPTWGIIRYGHHKTFSNNSRAMALEAGEACHQVFAATRIIDLYEYGGKLYQEGHARAAARRRALEMFGSDRTAGFFSILEDMGEDDRTRFIRSALYILETSGFYDDPDDKRRTIDKLSEGIIAYIDRYEFDRNLPVLREIRSPEGVCSDFVGIEQAFELVAELTLGDGSTALIRLTGKVDGMHCAKNNPEDIYIEENKTASRLGDAWEQSFEMSHQVTGYIMAARTILQDETIERAVIRGMAIPQPRIHDGGGIVAVPVWRYPHQIEEWGNWILHTYQLYATYFNDPLRAPKYTHSCNRYFRPCSFIPLCAADFDTREEFYGNMVVEEWSPLHEKSGD